MVDYPHIEVRDESPFVIGTEIPVRRIWDWFRRGVPAETLIKRYPALGPAKVLSALAFAFDNKDFVDKDVERAERSARADTFPPPPSLVTRF